MSISKVFLIVLICLVSAGQSAAQTLNEPASLKNSKNLSVGRETSLPVKFEDGSGHLVAAETDEIIKNGLRLYNLGNYSEALSVYRQAIEFSKPAATTSAKTDELSASKPRLEAEMALVLMALGRYKDANSLAEKAVNSNPLHAGASSRDLCDYARLQVIRGRCLSESGSYNLAEKAFNTALQSCDSIQASDKNYVIGCEQKLQVNLAKLRVLQVLDRRPSEAELAHQTISFCDSVFNESFKKACSNSKAAAFYYLANINRSVFMLDQAIHFCDEGISICKTALLTENNDIELLTTVTKLQLEKSICYSLASSKEAAAQAQLAMSYCDRALLQAPKNLELNEYKADAYALQGDFAFKHKNYGHAGDFYLKSLEISDKQLEVSPTRLETLKIRSRDFLHMSEVCTGEELLSRAASFRKMALELSDKAFEQAPDNITVLLWQAYCLRDSAYVDWASKKFGDGAFKSKAAEDIYDQVLKTSPTNILAIEGKGYALVEAARNEFELSARSKLEEQAVACFDKALTDHEGSASIYRIRGHLLVELSLSASIPSCNQESKNLATQAIVSLKRAAAIDSHYSPIIHLDLERASKLAVGKYPDDFSEQVRRIRNSFK